MAMLLDPILSHVPCPIFWKSLDGTFLGCNKLFLVISGFKEYNDLIGKTDSELPWKECQAEYYQDDQHVINTGETITRIESIPMPGREVISETTKSPLIENGKTIGVVGICLDITDRKEAERLKIEIERKEVERLKLENEVHKQSLYQQAKFTKVANQLAHDIRSPIASLRLIVDSLDAKAIPERERLGLKDALSTINDIVNGLLEFSKKDSNHEIYKKGKREVMFVSATLLQLLSTKRSEYKNSLVKFDYDFNASAYTAFIKIEPVEFKRCLSNVINNAVNALDAKGGRLLIKVQADATEVKIIVQDNGKGMPPEIVHKIMSNIAVTHDKKDGHGIGFSQIHGVLQRNEGKLVINSEIGKGAAVELTFPRVAVPEWFSDAVNLGPEDIVIILDDDSSIHVAWDIHFKEVLEHYPKIQLKHFEKGQEALYFIKNLSSEDKESVFLLTDYELLKQDLNGLDVIDRSKIKRSLLVTSHYANTEIQEHAVNLGTKIVPKQWASEIPININDSAKRNADIIIVDDDKKFAESLMNYVFIDNVVRYFEQPQKFLEQVSKYPKNTRICLDNNFVDDAGVNGISLAQELHKLGYTDLFLLSGDMIEVDKLPDYLTAILKTDIESIKSLV